MFDSRPKDGRAVSAMIHDCYAVAVITCAWVEFVYTWSWWLPLPEPSEVVQ